MAVQSRRLSKPVNLHRNAVESKKHNQQEAWQCLRQKAVYLEQSNELIWKICLLWNE